MIVPAAALVLPIFLELDAMHLIGACFSVILRSRSSRSASTSPTSTTRPRSRPASSTRPASTAAGELQTFLPGRAAAREAGRRARLLLQLRRRLEQLLPAVRRPRELEPVPDHGRPLGSARVDAVVQPGGRRRRPVGQHLQARARARDPDRRRAGGDRLPVLAARARTRSRRRSGEAVAMAGCVRGGHQGLR